MYPDHCNTLIRHLFEPRSKVYHCSIIIYYVDNDMRIIDCIDSIRTVSINIIIVDTMIIYNGTRVNNIII